MKIDSNMRKGVTRGYLRNIDTVRKEKAADREMYCGRAHFR